jgi:hypothetical protein
MANPITDGITRIEAYGELDYPVPHEPTLAEKNNMKLRLLRLLTGNPAAALPVVGVPVIDPDYPVNTIANIFRNDFFCANDEGGILVVDYANFEALARPAYRNLILKTTGVVGTEIPFVIPIVFLLNLIIEANYSQLILVVKRGIRVDNDLRDIIDNGYINNNLNGFSRTRYYMRDTINLIRQRIAADTLRINIIHSESSDEVSYPHSLKSHDDCTLIAIMHQIIASGINNYKFISGDMQMFDDFLVEKVRILPYKIRIESLEIDAGGNLIINTTGRNMINTTNDLFFTNGFTIGAVQVGQLPNRFSDTYTPRRISTGILNGIQLINHPLNPQGLRILRIPQVQVPIAFGAQNHLIHLLDLHFFKPGQNRNHRVGVNPLVVVKGQAAPPGPWYTRFAPIIFMNITEADLIADPDLNVAQADGSIKKVTYYGLAAGDSIRNILVPLPVGPGPNPASVFYGGYKEKYLKYKAKYLKLKQEMGL